MGETNVVDVYIYYLRNKIDDRFGEKIIETVRSVGYDKMNSGKRQNSDNKKGPDPYRER